MSSKSEHSLSYLLDGMENAANGDKVSVSDILDEFGDRSVLPFILLVALVMITPLSGIPGAPTIAALIIGLLSAQALFGRKRLWLPGFLLRRKVSSERLQGAVDWLRKPSAFLDRHAHRRLSFLTHGPMRRATQLACVLIPVAWPFLEILPMVTSTGALTIALLVFGLFTCDGLFVALGYAMIGVTLGTGVYFLL